MPPIIAISRNKQLHDYEEAVRRAGGEARVLDQTADSPADVIRGVGGLLLSGGGDVLPSLYGAEAHPTFSAAEDGRDAYELDLVRRALDADLPVFAICRGIQVLNVARGGTLVQDIPDELQTTIEHSIRIPPVHIAHDAWMTPDSLLERLMRPLEHGDACPVNSRHHQAVKDLGNGLVTVATAPDGVIEAIEDPSKRFCLGVQWHPENFYRTGEFSTLFEGFVRAASTR
jgi:putative glutamine amidotransferase